MQLRLDQVSQIGQKISKIQFFPFLFKIKDVALHT